MRLVSIACSDGRLPRLAELVTFAAPPTPRAGNHEYARWKDEGCAPELGCFKSVECPLAACIYDDPRGRRAYDEARRAYTLGQRAREMRSTTRLTVQEIADQLGVSRRQIFRYLALCRS